MIDNRHVTNWDTARSDLEHVEESPPRRGRAEILVMCQVSVICLLGRSAIHRN